MKFVLRNPKSNHLFSRKPFTLIEMVTVLAIIMSIMSLLQPALKRSMDHAYIVVCANNVRQMVNGLIEFTDDNNQLPIAKHHPTLIGTFVDTDDGIFSMGEMNPYIDAFDEQNERFKGIVVDPSAEDGADGYKEYVTDWTTKNFWNGAGGPVDAVPTMYTYWGGRTEGINGAEDYYGNVKTNESGVIYTCQLWWDNSKKGWSYNHGAEGWSGGWDPYEDSPGKGGLWNVPRPIPDGVGNTVPTLFEGANQGNLDGSVNWKPDEDFKIEAMWDNPGFGNGGVSNGGSSPIGHLYQGDTWFF